MQLSEIRDILRRLLDEDGIRRSDAVLDDTINEGYVMVSLLTQGYEVTKSFLYDASLHFSYLPSDMLLPVAVYFDGTRLFPSVVADWDDLNTSWMSVAAGTPVYYACNHLLSTAPELWLYPRPSGEGTVRLIYAATPGQLTADTDTPRFPAEHHYTVVWWAYMWELLKERGALFANKAMQTSMKFINDANALRQYIYRRTPDRDWLMPPLDSEAVRKKLHSFDEQAAQQTAAQEQRDLMQ